MFGISTMGRLVRLQQTIHPAGPTGGLEGAIDAAAPEGESEDRRQGDTYLERVAKYVPAELVAFYIFVNPILKQSLQGSGTMAGFSVVTISLVVFFGSWCLTPIYLWRLARPGDARLANAAVATALFPIWAYAVEGVGPTRYIPFDGDFASIVLGAASLLSGLVTPQAKAPVAQSDAT